MFDEILKAYKVCEDKTTFLAGQVPEEVRPELLAALDIEDEARFNSLMATAQPEPTVTPEEEKAIEPNESEIQEGEQPEVPDTTADAPTEAVAPIEEQITDTVALPDGEIATLTDEQVQTVAPTINAVADMTDQIQGLENLDQIPESLKEGVEIWKDADEDFSVKIITETVKRLYKGDFSETKDVTSGDIITTGAEVAKDLKEAGEHKTTLTKGIEEIQKGMEVNDLADLYSILGELKSIKEAVYNFVDYIALVDDLGLSPSKKKELAEAILDDGIFVDGSDKVRENVSNVLNSAPDFSARDMSSRLSIFKDFSEGYEDCICEACGGTEDESCGISPETSKVIEDCGGVDEAIECTEKAIEEAQEDPEVLDQFAQFSMDCAEQVAKINNIDPAILISYMTASGNVRTPYQQKVVDAIIKRDKDLNKPAILGGPGSKKFDKKYGALDQVGTQMAYTMPNYLGQYGKALDQKYGTNVYGQVGSDIGEWMLANKLAEGSNQNRYFSESEDFDAQKKQANLNAKLYKKAMAGQALTIPQLLALQKAGLFSEEGEDFDAQKKIDRVNAKMMKKMAKGERLTIPQFLALQKAGYFSEGDESCGDMGKWSEDDYEINSLAHAINDLPSSEDKLRLTKEIEDLKKKYDKNRGWNVAGKLGTAFAPIALLPASGTAWGVTAYNRTHKIEPKIQDLQDQINALKSANMSKDCSEEAPAEEQISQEVIDNALSNDDQIRALVEKYKMLPTVEAKDQMRADMQTLGFTDDVINMIVQYSEGNFSTDETKSADASEEEVAEVETPVEEVPAEAPAEETVDVASMVTPELFDQLLGPGVGEADPVDGTLPVGEVIAPGTEIGHLGTLDQGIPSGQISPEEDKDVTKVEIVSSDEDDFESIMR